MAGWLNQDVLLGRKGITWRDCGCHGPTCAGRRAHFSRRLGTFSWTPGHECMDMSRISGCEYHPGSLYTEHVLTFHFLLLVGRAFAFNFGRSVSL